MKYTSSDKEMEKIYTSDNQIVLNLNIKEGKIIPPHDSDLSVVVVIYEGEVDFTLNDETFNVKPGDIVVIKPKEIHSIKALKDSKIMVIQSDLK